MIKKAALRLLRKAGILKRMRIDLPVRLNNKKFIVPVINEVGFWNYLDLSEPWMQHILNRLLVLPEFKQKVFIDVGVNLGQTLLKVKSVDPQINYIGFEPNPICLHYLNALITLNGFGHTDIIPVGISDKTEVLKLNLYSDFEADSAASIIGDFRSKAFIVKSINVPVFSYADIEAGKGFEVGIIKIDVEGAEREVLRGFRDSLLSDKPLILLEVLPAYTSENKERVKRQKDIEELLREVNYSILRVRKENNQFVGVEEVHEFGIHEDVNLCEYILLHAERIEGIREALAQR